MRYLVTDGYKHISKPNAIIITNVFSQASIRVTREQWLEVMGCDLPFVKTDARISKDEIEKLNKVSQL